MKQVNKQASLKGKAHFTKMPLVPALQAGRNAISDFHSFGRGPTLSRHPF